MAHDVLSKFTTFHVVGRQLLTVAALRHLQSDVNELNWHGLGFDELSNGQAVGTV